ncbi:MULTISPECIES: hypothetical protein [unclassified Bradyrhizobium]|uniref:hypothetical protein n=1 Tax=unclassified Bradyrhizobium TaxID=2631580 RepID=UPI001FFB4C33|nr:MULTISPECIES: hypothetical protein [unclassified Bradyrhizobium]
MSNLSDTELMDIGTTRGEIDYVASHQGIDPRGIRSGEWLRYLPTGTARLGLPTSDRSHVRRIAAPEVLSDLPQTPHWNWSR